MNAAQGRTFPASHAQQRLWYLERLNPGTPVYNLTVSLRRDGSLDAAALQQAWTALVDRHEALRTTFRLENDELTQVVWPRGGLDTTLGVTDLTGEQESRRPSCLREVTQRVAREHADLERGPLAWAQHVRLGENEHVLVITVHHIVADAASMYVLEDDLTALYLATTDGAATPPQPELQYADYAAWQAGKQRTAEERADLEWWRTQLADVSILELWPGKPVPDSIVTEGRQHGERWEEATVRQVATLARGEKASWFMAVVAGLAGLLSRYTGNTDITIGIPVAGRTNEQLQRVVGLFVNRVVLRIDLSGDPTFRELLGRARSAVLDALAHQDTPFEDVVDAAAPERRLGQTPLFRVGLNMLPAGKLWASGDGAQLFSGGGEVFNGTAHHDLNLDLTETGDGMHVSAQWRVGAVPDEVAADLPARLRTLLIAGAERPDEGVNRLPLVSPAESERAPDTPAPQNSASLSNEPATISGAVTEFARTQPHSDAVVSEHGKLTYAELVDRAGRLARVLRDAGLRPEQRVALDIGLDIELVVGILGVLSAGGAYVPMDPDSPQPHRQAQLADSGATHVLTKAVEPDAQIPQVTKLHGRYGTTGRGVVTEEGHETSVETTPRGSSLAYVLYTSGSTGRPKGVAVEHRNVLAYAAGLRERCGMASGETHAMVQQPTFDSCLTALYGSLLTGGCLHLVPRRTALDGGALADYLLENAIDYLKITPSHLAALQTTRDSSALLPRRGVLLGGETSAREWTQELRRAAPPGSAIFTHYGPTETTVGVLADRLDGDTGADSPRTTLGSPLRAIGAYVLDQALNPLPPGVAGELYISGPQVARGYLGASGARATAAAFLPDPWASTPGARMYRTGDRARRLPDGTFEFIGRVDRQTKIRGVRVDPAASEATLHEHADVAAAVVIESIGQEETHLLGYAVLRAGAHREAAELRAHVAARLPEPQVPSTITILDALPLTRHGKLDRDALPSPAGDSVASFIAPRTEAERLIAGIFTAILGVDDIGAEDSFFERGGNSLRGMRAMARIRTALDIDIPIRTLLRFPLVSDLAAEIERLIEAEESDHADPAAAPAGSSSRPD